jgi:nitric oxide reductase large subunit
MNDTISGKKKSNVNKPRPEKKKVDQPSISTPNIKHLLINGTFWMAVFFGISYMFTSLAMTSMHWYRFVMVIIFIPGFFTLLSSVILRSMLNLEEKYFIKLVALTLNSIFKMLKSVLGNKNRKI